MSTQEREKRNSRIAMVTSIGIHAGLLILFLFVAAWRAPDPPLPEYGIELNFGVDTQGSGTVQPEEPVAEQPVPVEEPAEEPVEQPTEPTPVVKDPLPEPVQSNLESPVQTKVEEKTTPKVTEQKPVEKTPVVDPRAVFKPTEEKGQPVSQGDDATKAGDKGSEEGKINAQALYGNAGGGEGGSSLDLDGWNWDQIPRPNVPDNQTGQVVFEIKVNDQGEVVGITKLSSGVSIAAESECRKAIEKLTFSKKPGAAVPPISTGRITFVITAK